MAAHQFWRLTGFVTDSNILELSQAQLYDGVTLIAQAPTFTLAPTMGTAFPNTLRWENFSAPGFALVWNLTTPVESPNLRLGAGSSATTFPKELYCQYSDDGFFWSTNNSPVNVLFPGVGLMTSEPGTIIEVSSVTPTTWNPSDKDTRITLSNGNLTASGADTYASVRSVVGVSTGKWYWEITGDYLGAYGVGTATAGVNTYVGSSIGSWSYSNIGYGYHNNAGSVIGPSFTTEVLGLALDMDAGTLKYYLNGILTTAAFSGITGTVFAMVSGVSGVASNPITANFGATAFAYSPPSGHKSGFGTVSGLSFIPLNSEPQGVRWRALPPPDGTILGSDIPEFNLRCDSLKESFLDAYFGGNGAITGTVKEKSTPANVPLRRKVLLIDEATQLVIRQTWSDSVTGNYAFNGIRGGVLYSVISYDHLRNYRAVIADNLTPELMPGVLP